MGSGTMITYELMLVTGKIWYWQVEERLQINFDRPAFPSILEVSATPDGLPDDPWRIKGEHVVGWRKR
jgi:hypothetical protein